MWLVLSLKDWFVGRVCQQDNSKHNQIFMISFKKYWLWAKEKITPTFRVGFRTLSDSENVLYDCKI